MKTDPQDEGGSASNRDVDNLDLHNLADDLDEDVALEDDPEEPIDGENGPFIYSHGFTARVDLYHDDPEQVVQRLGWAPDSNDWVHSSLRHSERSVIRGSTFLTQRGPQVRKKRPLAMAKLNKELGTNLYSVAFERTEAGAFFTLRGVRHADINRLMANCLGLEPDSYSVAYYLDLERYIVLSPFEARKLAEDLDGADEAGRGRLSRKRWLLRDYEIPITIRKRAKRKARLNIYRISGGATAQYKVEISLKGRRQDKGHFFESDIATLDQILLDLVETHELSPVPKPARWEPVTPFYGSRDGALAKIGHKAYRGAKVPRWRVRAAEHGHTPDLAFWTGSPTSSTTSLRREYIRTTDADKGSPGPHIAWKKLAEDIARYDGYLSEVVLNPNQDPKALVEAIIASEGPGEVTVGVLGAELEGEILSWRSTLAMAQQNPEEDEAKVLVVTMDPSMILAVDEVVSPVGANWPFESHQGPLYPRNWKTEWGDLMPLYVSALAALAFPVLKELREICENTGGRVILVTVDARPEHGKGPLKRSHFYRDGRVRSHIGDAGRYWCHLRYMVETNEQGTPQRVGMVKDEAEGLMGRMLWGTPPRDLD